jgi:hypothetical protein
MAASSVAFVSATMDKMTFLVDKLTALPDLS